MFRYICTFAYVCVCVCIYIYVYVFIYIYFNSFSSSYFRIFHFKMVLNHNLFTKIVKIIFEY